MSINRQLSKNFFRPTSREQQIWHIAYLILIGLLLASAIYTTWFVYQNVCDTIDNAMVIVQISPDLNNEVINLPLFEQTQISVTTKQTAIDIPANLRNIFEYYSSPLPGAPTTTSST